MKLDDVVKEISLDLKTCSSCLNNQVTGAYVSDLLSDVMANSKDGNIWITLQMHMNIVAVAGLNNLAGIVVVGGRQPDQEILKKAETEKVAILTTPLTAFEVAGRLYQMLN
jgi:predicted transcriptional regulator